MYPVLYCSYWRREDFELNWIEPLLKNVCSFVLSRFLDLTLPANRSKSEWM